MSAVFHLKVVDPLPADDQWPQDGAARATLRLILTTGGKVQREDFFANWKAGKWPLMEECVKVLIDAGLLVPVSPDCTTKNQ